MTSIISSNISYIITLHWVRYRVPIIILLGIKFQDSLTGKRVLDLGCGRGGGCKFVLLINTCPSDSGFAWKDFQPN